MRISTMAGVALAALMATTGIAGAHQGGRHGPPMPMIDADKDGAVTRAEAATAADAMFAELDRDDDGALTPKDRPARPDRDHFKGRKDGDRPDLRFERREFEHHRGRDGDGPGRPPRPPHPPFGLLMIASMEEADANKDGKIAKDEFKAQQLRFFDAADVNGDGKIKLPPPPPEPPEPPQPPPPPR